MIAVAKMRMAPSVRWIHLWDNRLTTASILPAAAMTAAAATTAKARDRIFHAQATIAVEEE